MYSAIKIAKYVINKCTADCHPISNLQLQKILYYIQRSFLRTGTIAFSDEIEAWQFGPVVREVYNKYCGFGSLKICMNYDETIRDDYANIIDRIVEEKRLLDPWDMVDDTHTPGKAWNLIYRDGIGNHQVIPKELIRTKG